jgi:hypothetical protein
MLSLDSMVHIVSLVLSAVTIGTLLFKMGRWSNQVDSAQKHAHDARNMINALPQTYVTKEFFEQAKRDDHRRLLAIETQLQANTAILTSLSMQLGNLLGKLGQGV